MAQGVRGQIFTKNTLVFVFGPSSELAWREVSDCPAGGRMLPEFALFDPIPKIAKVSEDAGFTRGMFRAKQQL